MGQTAQARKSKAASLSVLSNTLLVIGKLIVGLMTGSVSVISEAAHSGLDLLAALIAYFAIKAANKPADKEHPYGHGKIENVSGTIEAILIFVAAIYIIYEAFMKLAEGVHVEALGWGILIMGLSSVINWFVSAYLFKVAKETDSIALEADAWHLRTDVYTSLGVLIGLALIQFTGYTILDPIIAIIVAVMIIKAAFDLTKESFTDIIDTRLPKEEEDLVREALNELSAEYIEFHHLRTRKAGAERYVDLHLVVPKNKSIEEVHNISDKLEVEIKNKLSNCQVLVHIEPCSVVTIVDCCKENCCQENCCQENCCQENCSDCDGCNRG